MDEAGDRQRKLNFRISRSPCLDKMPDLARFVGNGRFGAIMRNRAATVSAQET